MYSGLQPIPLSLQLLGPLGGGSPGRASQKIGKTNAAAKRRNKLMTFILINSGWGGGSEYLSGWR